MSLHWSEQDLTRVLQHGQVRLVGETPAVAPPISEAAFQAAGIRLAKEAGYMTYHTYSSKRSPSGFMDLIMAHPTPGHPLYAVELKTDIGQMTPAQEAWLQAIARSVGVVAEVWRPQDWNIIVHRLRDEEQPMEEPLKTYPPPPYMAAQLGQEGNPHCACATPMAAMFCPFGHMLECHAGMTCDEARCSHLARYE